MAEAVDISPGHLADLLAGQPAGPLADSVRSLAAAGQALRRGIAACTAAAPSELAAVILECIRVCAAVNTRRGDERYTFPLILAAAAAASNRSITESFAEAELPLSPTRLNLDPTAAAALQTLVAAATR